MFITVGSHGSDSSPLILYTSNIEHLRYNCVHWGSMGWVSSGTFSHFFIATKEKNETAAPVQALSADKPQAWWQPSVLPSFPLEPRWTVTSRCSPRICVPCQPQEPKIDADIRVQNPPMASLSSQLRKHRCPSGTPSIDG